VERVNELRDRYHAWRSTTPSWVVACLGGLIVGVVVGALLTLMTGSLAIGAVIGALGGFGWAGLSWHR
jgi:hypothetical protein